MLTGRGHGEKLLFRYLLPFYSAGYLLGIDIPTPDAKFGVLVLPSTLDLRLGNESDLFVLDVFVQMPLGYLDLVLALTMKTSVQPLCSGSKKAEIYLRSYKVMFSFQYTHHFNK